MDRREASYTGKPRCVYLRSFVLSTPTSRFLGVGLSQPPQTWTVIPPDQTISRHVEVLLSVDQTIYSVDNLENIDQRISRGPFTHMSPSPNGKSLALLTYGGLLWVVSTDFQRSLAEFDTSAVAGADGEVRQVEWCGNDAVLVTWSGMALLVGPFGDTLRCVYLLVRGLPMLQRRLICIGTSTQGPLLLSPSQTASGSSAPTPATLYRRWQHHPCPFSDLVQHHLPLSSLTPSRTSLADLRKPMKLYGVSVLSFLQLSTSA